MLGTRGNLLSLANQLCVLSITKNISWCLFLTLLLFHDGNGVVNWRGSDDITLAKALWMLEKVKPELLKRGK